MLLVSTIYQAFSAWYSPCRSWYLTIIIYLFPAIWILMSTSPVAKSNCLWFIYEKKPTIRFSRSFFLNRGFCYAIIPVQSFWIDSRKQIPSKFDVRKQLSVKLIIVKDFLSLLYRNNFFLHLFHCVFKLKVIWCRDTSRIETQCQWYIPNSNSSMKEGRFPVNNKLWVGRLSARGQSLVPLTTGTRRQPLQGRCLGRHLGR